jgi:uncharacterized protein YacL
VDYIVIYIIRTLFALFSGTFTFYFLNNKGYSIDVAFMGGFLGVVAAILIISLEISMRKARAKAIFFGTLGLVGGLITGILIVNTFADVFPEKYVVMFRVFVPFILGYIGLALGILKSEQFQVGESGLMYSRPAKSDKEDYKILDTSVIIDGRIADIAETGFLSGTLIIPRFVLLELQHIADSSDPMRRKRGRRGLDILNKLQKSNYPVEIIDTDFPSVPAVDSKLVELAKAMTCPIITNDFNLNKVAELQGVAVLNINELSNALRPVVLPGEEFKVFVLREGKEYNQGVGYLDDGTMVVVDSGREFMNQKVDVVVTSVLQTTAGRMIFARVSGTE